MLEGWIVYPVALVAATIVGVIAVRRRLPDFVVAMRVLFVLYLGWVVGATLFPLPVDAVAARLDAGARGVSVGLVPLASISEVVRDGTWFAQLWILGGNVLTLAPFGFLLPFAAPRLATWRRVALAAVLFPTAIELSQFLVSMTLGYSYRVTEVDDVVLNAAGILLGFAVFSALRDGGRMTVGETDPGPPQDGAP